MKTIFHKAEDRGGADFGTIKTNYSFSFANWYDPSRLGFGALRVLNDDVVSPRSGFPMHEHDNMEIITVVTAGAVSHEDSMGNKKEVGTGEVQVMSAGTGVRHSEMNLGSEPLRLFQIWITPSKNNIAPRYEQRKYNIEHSENEFTHVVSGKKKDNTLLINQDANIYLGRFEKGKSFEHTLDSGKGAYIFVVDGEVELAGTKLGSRDAVGIWDTETISFTTTTLSTLLVVDVRML
jgi:redox-sensitive bicupin YhaK (pirin superfamily)